MRARVSWLHVQRTVFLAILATRFVMAGELAPPAGRMEMYVGDVRALRVDARRIVVGNGKLLSVKQVEGGKLVILAEAPGTTALQLWKRDGQVEQWQVVISEGSTAVLLERVRSLTDGLGNVRARAVGEHVLLEGQRLDTSARDRVAAIAKTWPGRVLDLTDHVGWDDMILMEVKILELRRSASTRLGIRWDISADGPTAQLRESASGARSLHLRWTSELASRLEALRAKGEARIVAEPNLSCRSGGSARFVSGGELPVPVVNAQGTPDVQFREYGVILDIKPSVDSSGNVYAQIDTEVSDIDPSVQVMNVPAILKRRSMTEVNVRLGETVVIAGLLDHSTGREQSGLPGLSRLPLAGGLFRSTSRSEKDSELVVLITPRRLAPSAPGAVSEASDNWLERSERQSGGQETGP